MMDRANRIKEIIEYKQRRLDELADPNEWERITKNMECGEYKEFKQHCIDEEIIIAALRDQEQSKWISVKERLPDLELEEILSEDMDLFPCLAVVRNERARGGRYVTKVWYNGEIFMDSDCVDATRNVTHWMPLPKPPKEGAEG